MYGIHRYVIHINGLIHYVSHSITVFPEGSFIRDLCLIRDDYTVLVTVQLQKKSWFF